MDPMSHANMNVPPQSGMGASRSRRSPLVMIIVLVVVLALVYCGLRKMGWLPAFAMASDYPNPRMYQAVFLNNGQVYFGKIKKMSRGSMVLADVYYLQVTQPLQQQPPNEEQSQEEPQINLVKMGSEIHGPADRMVIPKTSVAFWEDIRNDGTVAQAIDEYKRQRPNGSQ
jgi:hypothetical protein